MWYNYKALTPAGLMQFVQTAVFQLEINRQLLQDGQERTFQKKESQYRFFFFCHFTQLKM